jgi:2-amino-4-hydroxy-6-hydroxymethyldihydropteridine diphosphokinase
MMNKAVIGIGTNIGDRLENIKNSLDSLEKLPDTTIVKSSRIYETKPWGYLDQQNFYNCCILVETSLSPSALLGALLGIEAALGRIREFKNGPRIIDLDLLLYEDEIINTEELTVPHPRIKERAFVLYPLRDLFEDEKFNSYSFSDALENADESDIVCVL